MGLFRAPNLTSQVLINAAQYQSTTGHFNDQMAQPGMDPYLAHDKAIRHMNYGLAYWLWVVPFFFIGSYIYLKAMERGNIVSMEAMVGGAALFLATLVLTVRRRQWLKSRADVKLSYRISTTAMIWIWIGLVVLAPLTFVGSVVVQGVQNGDAGFSFSNEACTSESYCG